jgi:hypothetical protein
LLIQVCCRIVILCTENAPTMRVSVPESLLTVQGMMA